MSSAAKFTLNPYPRFHGIVLQGSAAVQIKDNAIIGALGMLGLQLESPAGNATQRNKGHQQLFKSPEQNPLKSPEKNLRTLNNS